MNRDEAIKNAVSCAFEAKSIAAMVPPTYLSAQEQTLRSQRYAQQAAAYASAAQAWAAVAAAIDPSLPAPNLVVPFSQVETEKRIVAEKVAAGKELDALHAKPLPAGAYKVKTQQHVLCTECKTKLQPGDEAWWIRIDLSLRDRTVPAGMYCLHHFVEEPKPATPPVSVPTVLIRKISAVTNCQCMTCGSQIPAQTEVWWVRNSNGVPVPEGTFIPQAGLHCLSHYVEEKTPKPGRRVVFSIPQEWLGQGWIKKVSKKDVLIGDQARCHHCHKGFAPNAEVWKFRKPHSTTRYYCLDHYEEPNKCTYRGALAGCHDSNCPVHKGNAPEEVR